MSKMLLRFGKSEDGAITVDWVVLTAVVLGVLFGALNSFQTGVVDHAELTSETIDDRGIPNY